MAKRIILFLVLNFGALAIGSLFTSAGVSSDWNSNLNKAPWTPPGWVFGAAWTSIMICYAVYMAKLSSLKEIQKQVIALYSLQWLLNALWNPSFFYFREVEIGLFIILSLTLVVAVFFFKYLKALKLYTLLLLPYLLWLIIASFLNAYIFLYN